MVDVEAEVAAESLHPPACTEAANSLNARACAAHVIHGDPAERLAPQIADMRRRRATLGLPAMQYSVAAHAVRSWRRGGARARVAVGPGDRCSRTIAARLHPWIASGADSPSRRSARSRAVSPDRGCATY